MRFLRAKTEQVCRSSATTQPHSETLPSTHASPLPIHTRAFYFQLWLLGRLIPLFTAICPLFPFLAGRERISSTTSPSSGSRWGGRPVSTTDSFSSNHNAYLHHYQVAHHSPLTTHHSPLNRCWPSCSAWRPGLASCRPLPGKQQPQPPPTPIPPALHCFPIFLEDVFLLRSISCGTNAASLRACQCVVTRLHVKELCRQSGMPSIPGQQLEDEVDALCCPVLCCAVLCCASPYVPPCSSNHCDNSPILSQTLLH